MGDEKVICWFVSFPMQLPRIWNLLVDLPCVNVFSIDLQCPNAGRGGGDVEIIRNDPAAGMQPVKPG